MKKILLMSIFGAIAIFSSMQASFGAAGTNYTIRVDGLACPYCAYGIEKKFKKMAGISNIRVDLDKGLVSVDAKEGVQLKKAKLKKLFNDSGFTYRSMKTKPIK